MGGSDADAFLQSTILVSNDINGVVSAANDAVIPTNITWSEGFDTFVNRDIQDVTMMMDMIGKGE